MFSIKYYKNEVGTKDNRLMSVLKITINKFYRVCYTMCKNIKGVMNRSFATKNNLQPLSFFVPELTSF